MGGSDLARGLGDAEGECNLGTNPGLGGIGNSVRLLYRASITRKTSPGTYLSVLFLLALSLVLAARQSL